MSSYVIVGNGHIENDHSDHVDAADFVIRFNNPHLHEGRSGTKTDMLFLANAAVCIDDFVASGVLERSAAFLTAKFVVLPKHPIVMNERTHLKRPRFILLPGRRKQSKFEGDGYAANVLDYFVRLGKTIIFPPIAFFDECCAEIGLLNKA